MRTQSELPRPGPRSLRRLRHISSALLIALALTFMGSGGAVAAEIQVIVVQPADPIAWHFEPARLSVPVGTTVTWVNQGTAQVTVTSPDGLFDSEELPPGSSYSVTFESAGTFRYFCVPYPHMKGAVVVAR